MNIVQKPGAIILCILLFLGLKPLRAQELPNRGAPYIQAIRTPAQGITDINSHLYQNEAGLLFIQNTNGIHLYNGNAFHFIPTTATPVMALSGDTLFVGVFNKLYKLTASNNSIYRYQLKPIGQIPTETRIQKLMAFNNQLWALVGNKIYQWQNNGFAPLMIADEAIQDVYAVRNDAWVVTAKKVIHETDATTNLHSRSSHEGRFKKIITWNGKSLGYHSQKGLQWIADSSINNWLNETSSLLKKHAFSDMIPLNDTLLAVGTQNSGIIIVHKEGGIQKYIGPNSGLMDQNIQALFTDNNGNLWASHKKGVSRIEIPSSLNYFTHKHGLKGTINAAVLHDEKLYLGTSQGIYSYSTNDSSASCFSCPMFSSIETEKGSVNTFFKMNNKLYASTTEGIFLLKDNKVLLFYNRDKDVTTVVLKSRHKENTLYIGRKDGLSAIQFQDGLFLIKPKILGITGEITSLQEDSAGNLFASTAQKQLFIVPPYQEYQPNLKFHTYSLDDLNTHIHWGQFYSFGKTVALSTNKGLYKYNLQEKTFQFQPLEGLPKSYWAFPIATDSRGNVWVNIQSSSAEEEYHALYYFPAKEGAAPQTVPLYRKQNLNINSILPQEDGTIWFGGFEELIHFNPDKQGEQQRKFRTLINRITIAQDSVLLSGTLSNKPIDLSEKLTAHYNNPTFSYSSTSFESENRILYQSRLVGLDTTWSAWQENTSRSFTNLRKGDYTFQVRSKDIYGQISEPAMISFIVQPPLRRTFAAYILYVITLGLFIYLIITWRAYFFAKERLKLESIISNRTEELIVQKEKADNLLERVLPKSTANDLKSGKKARPAHYNLATVLFSDIQGFTKISEQLDSEHLIDELDRFFLTFDNVVDKYNIEKIKTIGDAYMCAGGIPKKNRTNPVEVVLAAMEMQYYMKVLKHKKSDGSDKFWDLRIGIDTGPVVAAVLGRNRISFDIWGSTVNTASRMEASSEPGKINITENTYMLIKDFFICTYRGKMPVKYKGEVDMYFVEGFKPNLASDLKGMQPNKRFFTQLQSLRWHDLEEFVMEKLEKGLPNNLYYHNVKHTIDVVTQVELIGRSEGVSEEDILLLKTAGLFHDMGHLINYDTHEEEGAKLAERILPEFKYTEQQIQAITKLIMVTEMPPKPTNLLEEIMCDADLDYLGRTDFVPVAYTLYKELRDHNKVSSLKEWNNRQVAFIKKHHYFTQTAKKLREVNKMNQLEKLEEELAKMEEDDIQSSLG